LPTYPELFLKLITDALGISSRKVKRTRHELATTKSPVARGWGRQMDSTSKEPPKDEEAPTTKPETTAITFDKDIYILTGKKGR